MCGMGPFLVITECGSFALPALYLCMRPAWFLSLAGLEASPALRFRPCRQEQCQQAVDQTDREEARCAEGQERDEPHCKARDAQSPGKASAHAEEDTIRLSEPSPLVGG